MISFISGLFIAFSFSLICWIICFLSYPQEYESPEDFLTKESIFFVSGWIALAIFAIPAAIIITKLVKHE